MKHGRKVSVVGLGYVGLPVAVALAEAGRVIAFDISRKRVAELAAGDDKNAEVLSRELKNPNLALTSDEADLKEADFHIIAVPTPINDAHAPDLSALLGASAIVGRNLKKGDIVVYESTVYPGATEEDCIPVLEEKSGLKAGVDFKVGYSPERINPGDREHTFTKIRKVVSAQDAESLDVVARVYESVVEPGVFRAKTIKTAEAAKVIENTQRDINIALMNELALVFSRLGLDTHDVLEAAGTKWNFLKFYPGLVGGHCIGVDPYYLTYRAEKAGYISQVILAGRRVNDGMGTYVAQSLVKELIRCGRPVHGAVVTVLGLTFKEDVPDLRNSRVIDIIRELQSYSIEVQVHDPRADIADAHEEYGISLTEWEDLKPASAVVAAVPHHFYRELTAQDLKPIFDPDCRLLLDIKAIYDRDQFEAEGIRVWRL